METFVKFSTSPLISYKKISIHSTPHQCYILNSMIPLAPTVGYWKKLGIWGYGRKGKRPHLKWSALQANKLAGRIACPFFKLCDWEFVLRS